MRMQTDIEVNQATGYVIDIHKFFQVVFVGVPSNTRGAQVDIYTALVCSSSADSAGPCKVTSGKPTLRVETTIDGLPPKNIENVGSEFYKEIEILRQFWGYESVQLTNHTDSVQWVMSKCANAYNPSEKASLGVAIPKSVSVARPLLGVFQSDKDIGPVLVIPKSASIAEDGRMEMMEVLQYSHPGACKKAAIANGFWLHEHFEPSPLLHEGVLLLAHELKTNCHRSDDFRVYYSYPPTSKVDTQSGKIYVTSEPQSPGPKNTDMKEIEIVQVYSQDCRRYFAPWEDVLCIKSSTLFRIEPNIKYEDAFAEGRVLRCKIRMSIVMEQLRERQRLVWLLSNIWLAAALAFGMDYTRSASISEYFPFGGYLDPSFVWLLMAVLVVPALFPVAIWKRTRFVRILQVLCVVCFGLWIFTSYFVSLEVRKNIPGHLIRLAATMEIALGALGLLVSRLVFENLATFLRKVANWRDRRRS